MISRLTLFRLCLILLVSAAPSRAAALRLACVGDSITAGYALKDPARDAYPAQLARLLGPDYEVRNFGVSAATLMDAGNYTYRTRPAHDEALAWGPDVVVIALGTNDTKAENIAAHPDDFMPSYRGLIARFRAANPAVKILVCLPPPAFPVAMGIAERVLVAEILPRIRQVATEQQLPLIDLHSPLLNAAALFPDRIHPNPEGAARIAQLVYGGLMLAIQPSAKSLDPAIDTAVVPVP
ncbi:MAG: hypothetical protein IPL39_01190 [Opitutaceae bacterium]|nr:hypothetical protein [Opitutaceae bacterium]